MSERLIFVPESHEENHKQLVQERVVSALEIASDACDEYKRRKLEPISMDGDINPDLFVAVFQQVYASL